MMPCGNIEENYIKKFSREISAQLQKVVIEPLKYDEQGVAFSTGEGKNFKLVGKDTEFFSSSHSFLYNINVCTTQLHYFFLYASVYIGCIVVNYVLTY